MAAKVEVWANRTTWMREAFEKYFLGGSRDQFANFLAMDGLPLACFSDKIIDLCQAGDFKAAAELANSDGWL